MMRAATSYHFLPIRMIPGLRTSVEGLSRGWTDRVARWRTDKDAQLSGSLVNLSRTSLNSPS